MADPKLFDYARYVRERTEGFSGRDWVFEDLNAWLSEPGGSRSYLLTGEPGSGKTAIAARLYQFSQADATPPGGLPNLGRDWLSAVHFCSARDRRWINPHTFAESLALQLAARYQPFAVALAAKAGDREIRITVEQRIQELSGGQATGVYIEHLDARAATPEDAFIRVVREPLEALLAAEPEVRPVILVDALDEALLYAGDVGILQLLSQAEELPPEVRFVFTSRPDERVENLLPDAAGIFVSAEQHDERNRQDVADYIDTRFRNDPPLRQAVAALGDKGTSEAAAAIGRYAGGNFQYLRFLLDDIAGGRRTLAEIRDLPQLPTGLDALYYLYSDSLGRVIRVGKRDWTADYAPLLQTLAVAQEPLATEQLRVLTGQQDAVLWRHLGDLTQFIEKATANGHGDSYRLYHQSFADFLARPTLRLARRELRNPYFIATYAAHGHIADQLLARHQGRWVQCTDRYTLRHLATHLAAAAEDALTRHARTRALVDLTTDDAFQAAHAEVVSDAPALRQDLERSLSTAARDEDSGAPPLVIHAALALDHLRRRQLRPESVFELARQGKLEAAERQLRVLRPDAGWQVVVELTMAWLALPADAAAARALRDRAAAEALHPPLEALLARLDADLGLRPPVPVAPLAGSPQPWVVAGILTRLSGGENATGIEPLDYTAIQKTDDGTVTFLAEQDGPVLVAYARATAEGTADFQKYIATHAANAYEYYRNRSLWALLAPVLEHQDSAWVRERVVELCNGALAGTAIHFREALPLALLAARARNGDSAAAAELGRAAAEAFLRADAMSIQREDDQWSHHLRRLAALAEAHMQIGQIDRAEELVDRALQLPYGFAGFRAAACLNAAATAELVRPANPARRDEALQAALQAAHNIQDSTFCARVTSRVNAMLRHWWTPPPPLAATVERFARDPAAAEFAPVHIVGETFARRVSGPQKLPLTPLALSATTLAEIATLYDRSVAELTHLDRGRAGAPTAALPAGTEVLVPDPEFTPWLSARLAGSALADAAAAPYERVRLLQLLVPAASADPTAADCVLARLLLAAAVPPAELQHIAEAIARYTPRPATAAQTPVLVEGLMP